MNLLEELKSGKAGIYAQWIGLISIIFLLAFGISLFLSSVIVFCIIAFVQAGLILLIEYPFCAKMLRGTDRLIQAAESKPFKAGMYAVFAVLQWLSLLVATSGLIVPAILLSLTAILYGIIAY
jgi:hypothetical protein